MKSDMKHDASSRSAGFASVDLKCWKHGEGGNALVCFFLLCSGIMLALAPTPIFAHSSQPPQMGALEMPTRDFYGLLRARYVFEEMRGQLHLRPKQTPLWEAWFAGAMDDSQQQYEGKYRPRSKPFVKIHEDNTTLERMALDIGQLHAETVRMQERMRRLEAAQARTTALYDVLDIDQRRIFDLLCRESLYTKVDQDLDEDQFRQTHQPPLT